MSLEWKRRRRARCAEWGVKKSISDVVDDDDDDDGGEGEERWKERKVRPPEYRARVRSESGAAVT